MIKYDKKIFNKCYDFAVMAHEGQKDKAGQDYIRHPLIVADIVSHRYKYRLSEDVLFTAECVAMLHDVIEDTPNTISDLLNYGIPFEIASRVEILTRGEGESYMNFIKRCGDDTITRCVKICDLLHNMDLTRLDKIIDEDFNRIKKYHKAYKYLEERD